VPDQPNGTPYDRVGRVAIFQPPGQQNRTLTLGYVFRDNVSVSALQSWRFGIPTKGNSGKLQWNGANAGTQIKLKEPNVTRKVITTELLGGGVRWDIDISSHYEHLIINYTLENTTDNKTIKTWQDVYSGKEPNKLVVSGKAEQVNLTTAKQTVTYDNLYDNETVKSLMIANPPNTSVKSIDWNGLMHVSCSLNYTENVVPKMDSANISSRYYIDPSKFSFTCYNITYPADSKKSIDIYYEQPEPTSEKTGSSGL